MSESLPQIPPEIDVVPQEVMAQWAETDKKIRATQVLKGEPFMITGIIELKEN